MKSKKPLSAWCLRLSLLLFSIGVVLPTQTYAQEINRNGAEKITAEEAVSRALANNFDIYIAQLNNKISMHEYNKARGRYDTTVSLAGGYADDETEKASPYLPKKSITADLALGLKKLFPFGTTVSSTFTETRSSNPIYTMSPNYNGNLDVGIEQPLVQNAFGFIDRSEVYIVKLDISRADLATLTTIESIIADTYAAYYALAFAYDLYSAKKDALDRAQEFLTINEEQLKTGLVEKTDLYAAEADVRLKEVDLLDAQDNIFNRSNDLKFVMNYYPQPLLVTTDVTKFFDIDENLDHHLKTAFKYRRDYQEKQIELESQDITIKINKQRTWPQIDLTATLQSNGFDRTLDDSLGEPLGFDDNAYFIGGTLSYPLENRSARAVLEQAKLRKAVLITELRRLEKTIELNIDQKLRKITVEYKKYQKNKEATELQLNKLNSEEKKFKIGRSNSDLIIRYQNDHINARINEATSLYAYLVAIIDLKRSENILLNEVTLPEETGKKQD